MNTPTTHTPPGAPRLRPKAPTTALSLHIRRVLWILDALPKPIIILTYRCPYTGTRFVREEGMN